MARQEKSWNQEVSFKHKFNCYFYYTFKIGPDGYSKSKQIDNEADRLSLAKELLRTAAICIQNFQRQQKPKPEPTKIQKYLIDFGIIEGKVCHNFYLMPSKSTFILILVLRYCEVAKGNRGRKNND